MMILKVYRIVNAKGFEQSKWYFLWESFILQKLKMYTIIFALKAHKICQSGCFQEIRRLTDIYGIFLILSFSSLNDSSCASKLENLYTNNSRHSIC